MNGETTWQRARCLPDSAIAPGLLVWVAGPPKPCDCGNPPQHLAYLSNIRLGAVFLWVGARYLELLPEFTTRPDIIEAEAA
jgi:hypothetical protein